MLTAVILWQGVDKSHTGCAIIIEEARGNSGRTGGEPQKDRKETGAEMQNVAKGKPQARGKVAEEPSGQRITLYSSTQEGPRKDCEGHSRGAIIIKQ